MYDRTVKPIPQRPTTGLRYRIESLFGLTGYKMAKYRISWMQAIIAPLNVVWRPHLLLILIFEVITYSGNHSQQFYPLPSQAMVFGFSIGINVSSL